MSSWVAIDFETANARRGSPCAVGLVRVHDGRIVEEWSSLIRPPAGYDRFDPFNVRVHGITAPQVADAPGWPQTLERIMRFAGGLPLVAHHAAFDVGVLAGACEASGLPVPDLRYVCTCVLAREIWTGLISYKLPVLAGALGIELTRHHDPAADARAAAEVLLTAQRRHGTRTLTGLLNAHQIQMGSYRGGVRRPCRRRGTRPRDPFPGADPDADPDNPFYGRTVCLTGRLTDMSRTTAAARLAALGAKTVPDVTKSVDLLVAGGVQPWQLAPGTAKTGRLARAERYRDDGAPITVIDTEEFRALLTTAER